MKRHQFFLVLIGCLLTAFLTLWAGRQASRTHIAIAQTETERPPEVEAFMQRMLADQQPPQNLEPMAYTPCVGGMADIYPCENVDLMAFMPLATIGGGNGNDIWGWTDSLDGKEYALMGRSSGTAFVDISDPVNPVYLGNLPTHTSNSTWRDIKVYNDYAFIVSEASGHGMQVFDLTRLRNVPVPPVTFTEDAHYNQFGNAHNIAINEDSGYAYAVGTGTCSGGLHMVNIQNPLSPTNAGCFSSDGYTHDTQCVIYNGPDVTYQGNEICFSSNTDSVTITDVTNKAAPVMLFRFTYSGTGYTHQGWLTEDQVYFLFDDELDEQTFGHNTRTRILNVTDLNAPTLVGFYDAPVAAIDHNLYTLDNYAFEANYRSGLRIVDITDIANGNLFQEGFFDVYPSSDSANFNGSWSVYPYYESGVVVVSGIEQGLFVLQPTSLTPNFAITTTPEAATVCIPEETTFDVTLTLIGGNFGEVTLAAGGVPAGYSADFATNPVTPPATTALTLTNSGPATPGVYSVDISGVSPTATHTTTVQLTLMDTPLATTLVSPANGATDVPMETSFSWTAVSGAANYLLEVATDVSMTNVVYSANTANTAHTIPAGQALDPSTQYYWRVTAENQCGSAATSPFNFTTEAIYGVTGSADMNGEGSAGETVTYTVWLTNTGSTTDTFDLTVNSVWNVTAPAAVTIASGTAEMVEVLVDIPADATGNDSDTATLTATSQGDPTESDSINLTTSVDALYSVALSPGQNDSGLVGTTVQYTILITNTGNLTDTFDLSVNSIWTTTLSVVTVTLSANESVEVQVSVEIPADAAEGEMDTATVTAVSQGDNTITGTITLTTTAHEQPTYVIYLPVARREN